MKYSLLFFFIALLLFEGIAGRPSHLKYRPGFKKHHHWGDDHWKNPHWGHHGECDGSGPYGSGSCDGSGPYGSGSCDGSGPNGSGPNGSGPNGSGPNGSGSCDGSGPYGSGSCDGSGPNGSGPNGGSGSCDGTGPCGSNSESSGENPFPSDSFEPTSSEVPGSNQGESDESQAPPEECYVPIEHTVDELCEEYTTLLGEIYLKYYNLLDEYYESMETAAFLKKVAKIEELQAMIDEWKLMLSCGEVEEFSAAFEFIEQAMAEMDAWGEEVDLHFFVIADMARLKLTAMVEELRKLMAHKIDAAVDGGMSDEDLAQMVEAIDICLETFDMKASDYADVLDNYADQVLQNKLWNVLLGPLVELIEEEGLLMIQELVDFKEEMCYGQGVMVYVEYLCALAHEKLMKLYEDGLAMHESHVAEFKVEIHAMAEAAEDTLLEWFDELKEALVCGDKEFLYLIEAKITLLAEHLNEKTTEDDHELFEIAQAIRDQLQELADYYIEKMADLRDNRLPDGLSEEEALAVADAIDACIADLHLKVQEWGDALDYKAEYCLEPVLWFDYTNPLVDNLHVLGDVMINELDYFYEQKCEQP